MGRLLMERNMARNLARNYAKKNYLQSDFFKEQFGLPSSHQTTVSLFYCHSIKLIIGQSDDPAIKRSPHHIVLKIVGF